jgi:hypothetical protein
MSKRNEIYQDAAAQINTIQALAKTIDMMAERDKNNVTLIPKNIELIDNIIIVMENLKKELIQLLNEMEIEVETTPDTLKN